MRGKKKRKNNVSDKCKKYLGPIRLKITKETSSYSMQVNICCEYIAEVNTALVWLSAGQRNSDMHSTVL